MRNLLLSGLISAGLMLGSAFVIPAIADEHQPAAETADMEQSEGMKKLKAMSDYLKSAKNMSFVVNSFFEERSEEGPAIKRFVSRRIFLQHPDKLVFRAEFDDGTERFGGFDGKNLVIGLPAQKSYTVIPVEGSIDDMIDTLQDEYGISIPITDFLYSDIYEAHKEFIYDAEYVGPRQLFGQSYDQIVVEGHSANWQLWIDATDKPLPIRFIAKFIREPGDPEYMATFLNWKIDGVDEAEFVVEIPEDWQEVDLKPAE